MIDGTEVACALCGARDAVRLYTKFDWGIERCRRCGLAYANPRAPEEAILARYSSEYFWNEYLPAIGAPGGHVDVAFIDERHAPMLALIRERAPGAHSLLEVGCGAGLFLKAASRAGWEAAGLELSAEGAAFARDRLDLDVRAERAEAMSFPAGAFDVAVMFDVIEHLFDPRAVLEATRRALKPGGVLVVSTPNYDALSRVALGSDWAVLSPLEHLYYFTETTLGRMLESCGFSGVTFERRFAGWGLTETMNHQYTHAPGSWRQRVYRQVIARGRGWLQRAVQSRGRADALLCSAVGRGDA
ncbi:MAG: class I SAM-dependent methyltransferase [Acidobacteria bacterium]|nr:class I SAM-dependent methyltransferase [Acidobacteriota bacterium]